MVIKNFKLFHHCMFASQVFGIDDPGNFIGNVKESRGNEILTFVFLWTKKKKNSHDFLFGKKQRRFEVNFPLFFDNIFFRWPFGVFIECFSWLPPRSVLSNGWGWWEVRFFGMNIAPENSGQRIFHSSLHPSVGGKKGILSWFWFSQMLLF